jgi:hypothetical protein
MSHTWVVGMCSERGLKEPANSLVQENQGARVVGSELLQVWPLSSA